MKFSYSYAKDSTVTSGSDRTDMSFAPDVKRPPTYFSGELRLANTFREAISALHDVVVSDLRFKPGDRVITRNIHPQGHTRLPRYVRGKPGVVELVHGCHAFPDSVASGRGDDPQWLYTVVFDSRTIWGEDADPTLRISIDAFEPYLEPA